MAGKQKKAKTKVSNLRRSRPTDEWLSWNLIDKMILAVHAAMEHSQAGKYKGPPKLGDCLSELSHFLEAEIDHKLDLSTESDLIHSIISDYRSIVLKIAEQSLPEKQQISVFKKRYADDFLIGNRTQKGRYKIVNYLRLTFSPEELKIIRSKKNRTSLISKERLYEDRIVHSVDRELPGYRTLNEWRAANIFGLKRPLDWNQIIEKYKKS